LKKVFVWLLVLTMLVLTACAPEGGIAPEWREPLSTFLMAVIQALIVPLLGLLVAWVYAKAKSAWGEFAAGNSKEAYWIKFVISNVVLAAEQMAEAHQIELDDKKQWALDVAEEWLNKYGISLDLEYISALIEAEVKQQFHNPKKLTAR
jgi:hypothetical protein